MRIRVRFTKHGKVRFTSHRDVARLWERALRRAELPVATSEGFTPRPKLHFGLALSTGHQSEGEYLDIDLLEPEAHDVDLDALPARLSPLLPPGLEVQVAAVVDRADDSLQKAVTSCSWRIEVPDTEPAVLAAATKTLLAKDVVQVTRERKGKQVTDDLRPGILHLSVDGPTPPDAPEAGAVLVAQLATHPRSVRPAELLAAYDPPLAEGRVCRTHQWITADGATREPLLPPGAPSTAQPTARAS
ncbi:TIGR03936 family radical SAM-associated protein [Rhabdothermincola salaria]|uniref:TIGR03936 family radical SAM-associated protein n=1 Tax=Rhabdothermincola salaria TaxID=2903142 RepID=UPI001E32C1FC|nr:TIGR03936 family radical SAM-associated protein [Rhabdothermincola salaria]